MTARRVSVPVWEAAAAESEKGQIFLLTVQAGAWKGELTDCALNCSSREAIPQYAHGICVCSTLCLFHAECLPGGPIVNWVHEQAGEGWDEPPALGIWYQRLSRPVLAR